MRLWNISIVVALLGVGAGLFFLFNVKTDVGVICAVLVMQCGWITVLLAETACNTSRKPFP